MKPLTSSLLAPFNAFEESKDEMRSLAGAAAAAATTAVVLTCRSRLLKKYVDLICSSS